MINRIKKIIMKITTFLNKVKFYLYYFFYKTKVSKIYDESFIKGNLSYLEEHEFLIWKNSFLSAMKYHCLNGMTTVTKEVWEYFPIANITKIKDSKFLCENNMPTVVFCVKDDLERVKFMFDYYRKYNVNSFYVLDNGSTDGTYEYLLEQDEVTLFKTEDKCNSTRKVVWMNRLMSYCGFNKWYLFADSDETLSYIGIENHGFNQLIDYANKNNITRFRGLVLDMYTNKPLFANSNIDDYIYFDSTNYLITKRKVGKKQIPIIYGGPRHRIMGIRNAMSNYPFIYLKEGTLYITDHFQWPYNEVDNCKLICAIMHYKFSKDVDNLFKIEDKNNDQFIDGYNSSNEQISFMYDGSVGYLNSYSLRKIPFMEEIKWK